MSIFILLLHTLFNVISGNAILKLIYADTKIINRYAIAFVIGAFIETLLGFILIWANVYEFISFYITTSLAIFYWAWAYFFSKDKKKMTFPFSLPKFRIIEWIILIPIIAKVILSLYAVIKMPLYFDDAMTHWSGRAKALYGHVNWSMDHTSTNFLGQQFGFDEYPLFAVVWRAISAHLNGGWNDIIAKGDSWIFFVFLLIGVYRIILKTTQNKLAALGATLLTSTLPIIWFHSISGYNEIIIACLLVLIATCLVDKKIIAAALLTACTIWTKNEGLFIFLPVFSSAFFLLIFVQEKFKFISALIASGKYFVITIFFISPWLIFKLLNGVALTVPLKPENYYHEGSLKMFLEMLLWNPSQSILWLCFFLFIGFGILRVFKSSESIFLTAFVILCLLLFIYVFCFTGSNIFLVNQMTIHRSFLQIAPLAIIFIFHLSFSKPSENLET